MHDVESYPNGTTRHLLTTDLVTAKTREVLARRLDAYNRAELPAPKFFDAAKFETLQALCARLVPQRARPRPVDIASSIDERLASGKTKGWRYDTMPPDAVAFRTGLHGVDETARAMFAADGDARFCELSEVRQIAVLESLQSGSALGDTWRTMPSARFFEELCAEAVEIYYAHPLAQDEIGYAGYADAHGWQSIELGQVEAFEPRALDSDAHGG